MKLILITLLFSLFHINSGQILFNTAKAIYTPQNKIILEGKTQEGEKITLEYSKSDNTLKKTGNSDFLNNSEFPQFLKLFLFPYDMENADLADSISKKLTKTLSTFGVDTKKTTLTVINRTKEAGISVGKDKRFEDKLEFVVYKKSLLPAVLKLEKTTILFSDYNKSVMPLTFPGKIEVIKDKTVVETLYFYRKEFYLD